VKENEQDTNFGRRDPGGLVSDREEKIMDSGLFFLTLSLIAVWLLLDEFIGGKRITRLANTIAGG
jgi:hypothetical protein